jgi:tRNA modification GTPase
MYSKEDTICAISTPPGLGAIAVIRCSGRETFDIADRIIKLPSGKGILAEQAPNTIHFATAYDNSLVVDQVMVSVFRCPHSYSGEDTVEISCHGSPYIQKKILELFVQSGARMATAGEFTMRAFLNGKLDLTQVEAVADLIASGSAASHKVAMFQMRGGFTREIRKLRERLLTFTSLMELELDFSEEDVEFADRKQFAALLQEISQVLSRLIGSFALGNVLKGGLPVAIVGKTNAGKSTLLNLLLSEERAIVSDIEGTTRDAIEDVINIRGIHFRLIDTAGIRNTTDQVEKLGIERTWEKVSQASVIIEVLDVHSDASEVVQLRNRLRLLPGGIEKRLVVVLNKIDLFDERELKQKLDSIQQVLEDQETVISMSAKTGRNLQSLEKALITASGGASTAQNDVIITNVRHFDALNKAYTAVQRAHNGLHNGLTGDLLAQDIRETMYYLGEITGEITNDEILRNIFKNFCIGK